MGKYYSPCLICGKHRIETDVKDPVLRNLIHAVGICPDCEYEMIRDIEQYGFYE